MNVKVGTSAVARGAILPIVLLLGVIVPGEAVVAASGPAPTTSTVAVTQILSTTAVLIGSPDPEG